MPATKRQPIPMWIFFIDSSDESAFELTQLMDTLAVVDQSFPGIEIGYSTRETSSLATALISRMERFGFFCWFLLSRRKAWLRHILDQDRTCKSLLPMVGRKSQRSPIAARSIKGSTSRADHAFTTSPAGT